MNSDYKSQVNGLVEKKRKSLPTTFSEAAVMNIVSMLEQTPKQLVVIAKHFDDVSSLNPIIDGKRSMRETVIHLLNIEGLNYTTIFPAFLLNKPTIYQLHAERDLSKLNLFLDFRFDQLVEAFCFERRKTLNFLRSLKKSDWLRQLVETSKTREETIYWRARSLAIHDFTHIEILKLQMEYFCQRKTEVEIKNGMNYKDKNAS